METLVAVAIGVAAFLTWVALMGVAFLVGLAIEEWVQAWWRR